MTPSPIWLCFCDSAWRWFSYSINLTSTLSIKHPKPTVKWHTIRERIQGTYWLIHISMRWKEEKLKKKNPEKEYDLLLESIFLLLTGRNFRNLKDKAFKKDLKMSANKWQNINFWVNYPFKPFTVTVIVLSPWWVIITLTIKEGIFFSYLYVSRHWVEEMLQTFSQTVESDIEFDFLKQVTKKVFNNQVAITAHIKQRQNVDNATHREEAISETNC